MTNTTTDAYSTITDDSTRSEQNPILFTAPDTSPWLRRNPHQVGEGASLKSRR